MYGSYVDGDPQPNRICQVRAPLPTYVELSSFWSHQLLEDVVEHGSDAVHHRGQDKWRGEVSGDQLQDVHGVPGQLVPVAGHQTCLLHLLLVLSGRKRSMWGNSQKYMLSAGRYHKMWVIGEGSELIPASALDHLSISVMGEGRTPPTLMLRVPTQNALPPHQLGVSILGFAGL